MYLGIDYGSCMLKLASTESATSKPKLVRLTREDPFLPAAGQIDAKGDVVEVGWSPYRCRISERSVVFGRRDKALRPAETVMYGGYRVDPVRLHLGLLHHAGREVARVTVGAQGMAISVPDDWSSNGWALPVAAASLEWSPNFFVREWTAVAAIQELGDAKHAIFVSLGAGSARVTLCVRKTELWEVVECARLPQVSGELMKTRLVTRLAEEMISVNRRDPREDAEANRALWVAADQALVDAVHHGRANVDLSVFGRVIRNQYGIEDFSALGSDFRSRLVERVRELCVRHHIGRASLFAWGELSHLFPLRDWFADTSLSLQVTSCPLDSVAAGAARLSAVGPLPPMRDRAELWARLSRSQGTYLPVGTPRRDGEHTYRVLECLPLRLPSSGEVKVSTRREPHATLTSLSDDGFTLQREIGRHLTVGRNPQSGVVLDAERFPEVSNEHCVIAMRDRKFMLKDLNSTNGTFVNGQRVSLHELSTGDVVQLGQQGPKFRFQLR